VLEYHEYLAFWNAIGEVERLALVERDIQIALHGIMVDHGLESTVSRRHREYRRAAHRRIIEEE
jgi:hypothetical protein